MLIIVLRELVTDFLLLLIQLRHNHLQVNQFLNQTLIQDRNNLFLQLIVA